MFNIVLYEPEIPPNTGNIIRLCANTGCQLHLIQPLGFALDDKRLRRAGLDYGEWQNLLTHENWQTFVDLAGRENCWAVSTKGTAHYHEVDFQPDDYIIFGPETRGLPTEIRNAFPEKRVIRIPMLPDSRSMNLSNAASVLLYEAWRQQGFKGSL